MGYLSSLAQMSSLPAGRRRKRVVRRRARGVFDTAKDFLKNSKVVSQLLLPTIGNAIQSQVESRGWGRRKRVVRKRRVARKPAGGLWGALKGAINGFGRKRRSRRVARRRRA